jgi:hypothetical protein
MNLVEEAMQSYRLVIGSDGKVEIPNGQPGHIVTVLVEGSLQSGLSAPAKPISSMTREEREQLKEEFSREGNAFERV